MDATASACACVGGAVAASIMGVEEGAEGTGEGGATGAARFGWRSRAGTVGVGARLAGAVAEWRPFHRRIARMAAQTVGNSLSEFLSGFSDGKTDSAARVSFKVSFPLLRHASVGSSKD